MKVGNSQNCSTYNVKPKLGQYGYQERTGDERCEGLFTENISGVTLDVLSLTYGQIHYKLYEKDTLTIKAPFNSPVSSLNIKGINFGMYDSYRLDLIVKANNIKKVPIRDVLMPNKIGEKNIGIYGYFQSSSRGIVYVPAYVYSLSYENKLLDSKSIYLKLLTNTILQEVEWRYAPVSDDKCGIYSSFTKILGTFTSQVPVSILLTNNTLTKNMCLEIRYKTASGEYNSKIFNLSVAQ